MAWERTAVMFVIAFPACTLADGRYTIEATELEYGASDQRTALQFATWHVAALAELPPWKPLLRELALKATVTRKDRTVLLGH